MSDIVKDAFEVFDLIIKGREADIDLEAYSSAFHYWLGYFVLQMPTNNTWENRQIEMECHKRALETWPKFLERIRPLSHEQYESTDLQRKGPSFIEAELQRIARYKREHEDFG